MSPTTVLIVPQNAPQNVLKPNLMPFHIAYSGSAPISSYFLKRPLPPPGNSDVAEDTTYLIDNNFVLRNVHNFHKHDENEQSADTIEKDGAQDASNANQEASTSEKVQMARYQAAFRGRVVMGQDFPLPEGFVGVVLHRDDAPNHSIAPAPPPKPTRRARKKEEGPAAEASKRSTRLAGAQRANALKAKAAAKAKARQQRVPTKFNPDGEEDELIDDDDDLPSAPAVLAALTVLEPKAEPKQEEEVKQEEEEEGHMEVEEPPSTEDKHEDQVDKFEVTGTFREFVLWNADVPVDEARDEYLRAIHEWVNIAAEINRI